MALPSATQVMDIDDPETDGLPMAASDLQRQPLSDAVVTVETGHKLLSQRAAA